MAALPEKLKPIGHFIKIANEHSTRDPVVYYWCLFHAVQTGMKIDKQSPECVKYLTQLLGTLEEVKKTLAGVEAVTQDVVAHAHLEQYALRLFERADQEDRAGHHDKNVVKAFYTAGQLFDVLALFGELDDEIVAARKYAKWKATYIHNCLKRGQVPVAGPPDAADGDGDGDGGDVELFLPPPPPADQPLPTVYDAPQPAAQTAAAAATGNVGVVSAAAQAVQLTAQDYNAAQKFAKYAISAIQYEDAPAAIDNLQKAIATLQKT